MGIDFAIDELYATGWTSPDSDGCQKHQDGRPYPNLETVTGAFRDAGYELTVTHIQLFDCYRAEWRETSGGASGAVVGQTEDEASVYALSQLRRLLVSHAGSAGSVSNPT